MAQDGKVRLPSSSGGIMQYYDEYHSKINISPWHVVVLVIIVMIIITVLHLAGPAL